MTIAEEGKNSTKSLNYMETQQKLMVGTVEKVNVLNEGRPIERDMGGELPKWFFCITCTYLINMEN